MASGWHCLERAPPHRRHAWSNNAELALTDTLLLGAGVYVAHALDDRLGVARKTVLSQRDVPGMERSTIPVLRYSATIRNHPQPSATIRNHP